MRPTVSKGGTEYKQWQRFTVWVYSTENKFTMQIQKKEEKKRLKVQVYKCTVHKNSLQCKFKNKKKKRLKVQVYSA